MSYLTIIVSLVIMTFMVQFSVYFCHLFLISSAFVMSLTFLLRNHVHPCMKCSLDISTFLEEVSSLSHFIVFFYFFVLFIEGFLISPGYSLEFCIQLGISVPFSLAFYFSSFLNYFLQLSQTSALLLAFLFLWDNLGQHLLYNVKNLCPYFFRHSLYQIKSLESIHHLHSIIIRDLI